MKTNPNANTASTLRSKLAIVGLSGLMFTGVAVGLTGIASAQSAEPEQAPEADTPTEAESEAESDWDYEISPEDEAVFERFEACLDESGVNEDDIFDEDGEELTDADWDAIDTAIESCEPILEDLSDDAVWFDEEFDGEFHEEFDGEFDEDFELSAEDEAVFETFDQCLADNGLNEETFEADLTEEDWEALEESVDQAFETCEPILENLSEDAQAMLEEGCPDDHEDGDYVYEDGDVEETVAA